MKTYPIHKAAALLPSLNAEDLAALAEDIKANGLHNPIVLHEGKVLDGRNRLAACELAEVEPRFVEWVDPGCGPVSWVVSQNVHRRHLTQSQLAFVALDALPMLEKEARERQGKRADLVAQMPPSEAGKSRDKAAALFDVSARYIQDAKAIAKRAPEMVEAIRSGEITITAAKRELSARDEFVTFSGVTIRRRELEDYQRFRDLEKTKPGCVTDALCRLLAEGEPSREALYEELGIPYPTDLYGPEESLVREWLETHESLERDFPALVAYFDGKPEEECWRIAREHNAKIYEARAEAAEKAGQRDWAAFWRKELTRTQGVMK